MNRDKHSWIDGNGSHWSWDKHGIWFLTQHGGWELVHPGASFGEEGLRLAKRVRELEKWIDGAPHRAGCMSYYVGGTACDCGLEQILRD